MRRLINQTAVTSLLAAALIIGPVGYSDLGFGNADVAYAGNGNGKERGNGNRQGGNSNRGGGNNKAESGSDRQASHSDRRGNDKPQRIGDPNDHDVAAIRPNEKGRWNASGANQNALDAHIRNQNFNGTVGILSQYQLAAKAANGEALSDSERRALETFIDTDPLEVSDSTIEDFLNRSSAENGYTFNSDDGVITCKAGCDGLTEEELAALETRAQNAADKRVDTLQAEFEQKQLDGFLFRSERRIVRNSNKELTPERNQDLLDDIASDLDVVRLEVSRDLKEAGEEIRHDFQQAGREIRSAFRSLFNNN